MKVGFDFDDTLNTISGTNIAQHRKAKGDDLYIISARHEIGDDMKRKAESLGIPSSNIHATGSNKAKVEEVVRLGLNIFYDNNPEVISELRKAGIKAIKV